MKSKIEILYVDDEIVNLQLFQYNFSKQYTPIVAESPMKGLALLKEHPGIKVVISDVQMPEMNGLEFIKKAKCDFCDKKYFILTGFEITDEIKEAIDSQIIIEYFRKPFDMNEIRTAINEAVRQSKTHNQH